MDSIKKWSQSPSNFINLGYPEKVLNKETKHKQKSENCLQLQVLNPFCWLNGKRIESSRSGKFVLFWQYVSSSELANRISFIAKYKTMKIYCPDAGGKGSPKNDTWNLDSL